MKRVYLIILLAIVPILSFSQDREKFETVNPIYHEFLPLENGKITYSEVVQIEDVSKDELFVRANDWIVRTFNSAKDVIQFSDKEAGKIMCKTITGASTGKGWSKIVIYPVYYLISIEVKEGRYKIIATDFIHHYENGIGFYKSEGDNHLEAYFLLQKPTKKELNSNMDVAKEISKNILDIFSSAREAITVVDKDNW